MRIIEGFKRRVIAGQSIISGEGLRQVDFNKIIGLNPTAAYLWEQVEGIEFTQEMLVDLLTSHYDVDEATAQSDAAEVIKSWTDIGLIEE